MCLSLLISSSSSSSSLRGSRAHTTGGDKWNDVDELYWSMYVNANTDLRTIGTR